ncbi:unnamed protein product [Brachionus calyciflorus]|uniref:Uncharacterized protein n=1 Tax=Brachionus calyciflorus TaxID=104777 RepID=A0A813RVI7_9BILA|nr:unnamed protein product [Brachionus calyciflorus]
MSTAPTQAQPTLTASQAPTQAPQAAPALTVAKAPTQSVKPESPKLTLSAFSVSPFALDASFGFGLYHPFGAIAPLSPFNSFAPLTSAYPFSGSDTFSFGQFDAAPYYGSSFGAYPFTF